MQYLNRHVAYLYNRENPLLGIPGFFLLPGLIFPLFPGKNCVRHNKKSYTSRSSLVIAVVIFFTGIRLYKRSFL